MAKPDSEEMIALEERLLSLGRKELAAEQQIHRLRKACRAFGESGQFEKADAAWALMLETQTQLGETQAIIIQLEARLYRMRRQAHR